MIYNFSVCESANFRKFIPAFYFYYATYMMRFRKKKQFFKGLKVKMRKAP
jgi:hypothetical protein